MYSLGVSLTSYIIIRVHTHGGSCRKSSTRQHTTMRPAGRHKGTSTLGRCAPHQGGGDECNLDNAPGSRFEMYACTENRTNWKKNETPSLVLEKGIFLTSPRYRSNARRDRPRNASAVAVSRLLAVSRGSVLLRLLYRRARCIAWCVVCSCVVLWTGSCGVFALAVWPYIFVTTGGSSGK